MKRNPVLGLIIGLLGLASVAGATTFESERHAVVPDFAVLNVIHAIPGLPSEIDVIANDRHLQSLGFADQVGPYNLISGDYKLQLRLKGVTVLAAEAELEAGVNYTAVAYLTDTGGMALGVFKNDTSPAEAGSTRLTLRHTANAPKVDVRLLHGDYGLADMVFRGFANASEIGPMDVAAGAWSASILAGGTEVASTGMLNLKPGVSYVVFAVGEFAETFEFFVQEIPLQN